MSDDNLDLYSAYCANREAKDSLQQIRREVRMNPEDGSLSSCYAAALYNSGNIEVAVGYSRRELIKHPEDEDFIDSYFSIINRLHIAGENELLEHEYTLYKKAGLSIPFIDTMFPNMLKKTAEPSAQPEI